MYQGPRGNMSSHVRVITQQDERKNRGGDWLQAVETARSGAYVVVMTPDQFAALYREAVA